MKDVRGRFLIEGEPIAGSFLSGRSLSLLETAHAGGCNLVTGGRDLLDPGSERGGFALDHGIKVMYSIAGEHIHGRPRLAARISPEETSIPIEGRAPETEDHRIVIDGEVVRYERAEAGTLSGCERGSDGTRPGSHAAWTILFWPGPLCEVIKEVGSSPNLWGYWALDDNPGMARSAMRGLYSTVHEADPKPHPVCAGYTNTIALMNFAPGVCDMAMLYFYPISKKGYFRDRTTLNTQCIMSHVRRVAPGTPFVGIYQGFWGGQYQRDSPLSESEIREQVEDFIREGSAGIMAFALLDPEKAGGFHGWNEDRGMIESVRGVNREVSSGRFRVPDERKDISRRRIIGAGGENPRGSIPGVPLGWYILGPFHAGGGITLETPVGPERMISQACPAADLSSRYEGKVGEVSWQVLAAYTGTCVYSEIWSPPFSDHSAAFAYCLVRSERDVRASMLMGCDVDMRVYIDGVVRHDFVDSRGLAFDDVGIPVRLRRGENHVFVKTVNEKGCWAFVLRFTEKDGVPLEGLSFEPACVS